MIGMNIKNIRLQKKITQQDLALRTNINQSIISRYENGTIVPPIPKLELIAKALEIPLINLLSNDSLCS